MELKQIYVAVSREDGSVVIMGFLTQGRGSFLPLGPDPAEWIDKDSGWWKREPTDANLFAEITRSQEVGGPAAVSYKVVDVNEIPEDRSYRNALSYKNGKFTHDMNKAKDLHKDKLRRERVRLFDENDIELRDANLESSKDKLKKAIARRNYLRDITKDPRINAAKTVDDLKKIGIDD